MDDIIAFLTSPGGAFAAVAAVLGIIATVQSIVRPYLDRRRERKESKARLEIADLQLSELSRSSNSYELRFVVTNTGKSKAVMRALRIQVLDRTPSTAEVETVPEAPMRVNEHRVQLIEGKDVYDIRARAFGPALPPLSFEEAEAEGFVVKIVSTELMRYELQLEAEWYDAKEPKQVQTVPSGVFLLDFPRRVAAGADKDAAAQDPSEAC